MNDQASHIAAILRELQQESDDELARMVHRREVPTPPWQVDYDSGWVFMWDEDEEDETCQ